MKTPNTKEAQGMECPMTNLQFPKKIQFPSSKIASRGAGGGNWELGIGISLDLGHWELEIRQRDVFGYLAPEICLAADQRLLTADY